VELDEVQGIFRLYFARILLVRLENIFRIFFKWPRGKIRNILGVEMQDIL
jgi:hypothetical protein